MRKRCLLLTASALLLLPGCLKTFREAEPRLELDREETLLRAKSGDGIVRDTFYVSSNRSWAVCVADGVDWLDVVESGFENPAEIMKTAPLVLLCRENSNEEERSASVLVYGAGHQKEIVVHQKGLHPLTGLDDTTLDDFVYEDLGTY